MTISPIDRRLITFAASRFLADLVESDPPETAVSIAEIRSWLDEAAPDRPRPSWLCRLMVRFPELAEPGTFRDELLAALNDWRPAADSKPVPDRPNGSEWPSRQRSPSWILLATAAVLLVALSSSLALYLRWPGLQAELQESRQREQTLARALYHWLLDARRRDRTAALEGASTFSKGRPELTDLVRRLSRDNEQQTRTIASLRAENETLRAIPGRPIQNVSVLQLYQDRDRSSGTTVLEIPAVASHSLFVLGLGLEEERVYSSFYLELQEAITKRQRALSDLESMDGFVTVALPREALPAGTYKLSLSGVDGDRRNLLRDYEVTVRIVP